MSDLQYQIRGGNQITLSDELEREIKDRYQRSREDRFQLHLLSSALRNKYLNRKTNSYSEEFQKWYSDRGMNKIFGSLSNFTKHCGGGDVINWVGMKTSDPQKYLNQLPMSVGALYELSIILKSDEDLFKLILQFTPSRKSIDEPKYDWVTKKPPLVSNDVTEEKLRNWRRKWENPPPPKTKRTDKRTLKFVEITCNGELFDFDRKTGDKIGCLDLDEVEEFLIKLRSLFDEQTNLQFKLTDHMEYLTNGYFKRKESYDVTRNIKSKKSSNKDRYV